MLALVALPTLGVDTRVVFTLGGVVGVSFGLCVDADSDFDLPTRVPTTPLDRICPIFLRHWSVLVPRFLGEKTVRLGVG